MYEEFRHFLNFSEPGFRNYRQNRVPSDSASILHLNKVEYYGLYASAESGFRPCKKRRFRRCRGSLHTFIRQRGINYETDNHPGNLEKQGKLHRKRNLHRRLGPLKPRFQGFRLSDDQRRDLV